MSELKLGVRVLLGAIFEAKKTGKGRSGRGKIYVELMKIITDSDKDISLSLDGNIDRFILRLLRDKTDYPYLLFRFENFEKSIGNYHLYLNYVFKMTKFCDTVLNENKIEHLVYTLLEVINQDSSISKILYGSEFIPKEKLFGGYAHPKCICLEALLLGLLYHVHKNPAESENIELLNAPDRLKFHLVRFSDDKSLELEMPIKLIENIHENAKRQKSAEMKYRLELRNGDEISTAIPDSGNVFLYGVGGVGKSTLLLNRIRNENTINFYFPLYQYKKEIHENLQPENCWILLNILLKYHYQYEYPTYETCSACEEENVVLQQLTELDRQLKDNPDNWKKRYVLLLDGLNEMSSELQGDFVAELTHIVNKWKNVRIIVTGRTIPIYAVFDDFQQLEICGVSDIDRDDALSAFADIPINTKLLELLKIPMFLNMYLENRETDTPLNTRGEILDSYIMNLKSKSSERFAVGIDNSLLRFIVQYILPCAAKIMVDKYNFVEHITTGKTCYEISRGDLFKAIDKIFKIYILDEYVYQSYIAPKGFRKNSLLESREKADFIELIIENIGLMKISENDPHKLHFTHQYFRDYFAAKHILNLLNVIETSYENSSIDEQKEVFKRFELAQKWFNYDGIEIYRLLGEICGDYKNIPDGNDSIFWYERTILDRLLDMYRKFNAKEDSFHITENVINVMSVSRNGMICNVDFSRIPLPFNIPCNIKFSQNGEYPCRFRNSIVDCIGICDNIKNAINTGQIWERYAVTSSDKKQILIILNNNYVLLWDNISEKILWDLELSEYAKNIHDFDYAEFSADENKIYLYAGYGLDICKVTVDSYIGQVTGYGQANADTYDFTNKARLNKRMKLKIVKQLPHFKNCNFSGAKFIFEDYSKILSCMGGLI